MNELYARLAETLEVGDVKPADVLADFPEWDSLTVLTVLAMLDSSFGVNMSARELGGIRTAGELATAVAARQGKQDLC